MKAMKFTHFIWFLFILLMIKYQSSKNACSPLSVFWYCPSALAWFVEGNPRIHQDIWPQHCETGSGEGSSNNNKSNKNNTHENKAVIEYKGWANKQTKKSIDPRWIRWMGSQDGLAYHWIIPIKSSVHFMLVGETSDLIDTNSSCIFSCFPWQFVHIFLIFTNVWLIIWQTKP